jgi:hypothetical protein
MTNHENTLFRWTKNDRYLFAISLAFSLLSKGQSLFGGLALDDYGFLSRLPEGAQSLFLSQGRVGTWIIYSLVDHLHVGSANAYFAGTAFELFLQSILVVTVIRFISYTNLLYAGIVAGLMTAHPYLSEIFTFKAIAIANTVALLATVFAIETTRLIDRKSINWIIPIVATFIALTTYQVMINVLLATTFGAMLMNLITNSEKREDGIDTVRKHRWSWELLIVSITGAILSVVLILILKWSNQIDELTGRAKLIRPNQILERGNQVWEVFIRILIRQEAIFPVLPKIMFLSLIAISFYLICMQLIVGVNKFRSLVYFSGLILLLPILSLGTIVPFGDWWPVPRVLFHNSILLGSIVLVAEKPISGLSNSTFRKIFLVTGFVVSIMFILLSNQVFSDQFRINRWDMAKAQRIVSRMEEMPQFTSVSRLYIDGGAGRYPLGPYSIQGDMNLSAFYPSWSKIGLINEASGYSFGSPTSDEYTLGSEMCAELTRWPDPGSVVIVGELGVVCLEK